MSSPTAPLPGTPKPKSPSPAEAVLRRLEWTVLKRLDGLLHGDYRTLFRGHGLDFADLREYQYHDDVRHIDWNVTARLDTPYVREFTEDREVGAWFLVDASPSVDFGSGSQQKRQVASEFVGAVAQLLSRHGNRVGALVWGAALDAVIPARGGRRHVLHLLQKLLARPALDAAPATDLSAFLRAALNLLPRRSLVFVVSDFISTPGWQRPLAQLARRHEVVAVRLSDPLERDLPDLGLVALQDAESGEQIVVDTHDRAFRRRYAEAAARREAALHEAYAQAGVDVLELATDDDLALALLRFAELRKLRRRLNTAASSGAVLPAHLAPQASP